MAIDAIALVTKGQELMDEMSALAEARFAETDEGKRTTLEGALKGKAGEFELVKEQIAMAQVQAAREAVLADAKALAKSKPAGDRTRSPRRRPRHLRSRTRS